MQLSGNFLWVKFGGATPILVTFRGVFQSNNFDDHSRHIYLGVPPSPRGCCAILHCNLPCCSVCCVALYGVLLWCGVMYFGVLYFTWLCYVVMLLAVLCRTLMCCSSLFYIALPCFAALFFTVNPCVDLSDIVSCIKHRVGSHSPYL